MRYSIKVIGKTLLAKVSDMRTPGIFFVILLVFAVSSGFAQGGGKAEPQRIKFAPHSSIVTLTGTLKTDEEMEYVFAAVKGQTVTIKNSKTSLFDFRVFSEEFDFETEFESSPTLTFVIPETGDYNFFVRKKMVRAPRTARFSILFAIH